MADSNNIDWTGDTGLGVAREGLGVRRTDEELNGYTSPPVVQTRT